MTIPFQLLDTASFALADKNAMSAILGSKPISGWRRQRDCATDYSPSGAFFDFT
jgi:hypothetical protein